MKSVVTIEEHKCHGGWRFVVKDISHIIAVIKDTNKKSGRDRAVAAGDEYRDMVLEHKEDPRITSSIVCQCGRTTSQLYSSGDGRPSVCLTCAKKLQSQTQTEEDEQLFEELVDATEEVRNKKEVRYYHTREAQQVRCNMRDFPCGRLIFGH